MVDKMERYYKLVLPREVNQDISSKWLWDWKNECVLSQNKNNDIVDKGYLDII